MEVEVWRHGGRDIAKMLGLEDENRRLKRLLADSALEIDAQIHRLGKLLTPAQQRRAAQAVVEKIGLSQRRACAVASCNRKTYRRLLRLTDDADLRQRLCELAAERRRFGYRRLNVLMRREGIVANHKRVYRIYGAAKLQVRKRLKRRVALGRGEAITPASQPNVRWSLDFVDSVPGRGVREALSEERSQLFTTAEMRWS